MDRLDHAFFARELVDACGGPTKAAERCRVGKSQLADYGAPHGEGFMPADVIADLERCCGRRLYSTALFEAHEGSSGARCLTEETCDAVEHIADLQRAVRQAVKVGKVTSLARERLRRQHAAATEELRHVGELLAEGD